MSKRVGECVYSSHSHVWSRMHACISRLDLPLVILCRRALKRSGRSDITNLERLLAGAGAGVTATMICFPLDTVRVHHPCLLLPGLTCGLWNVLCGMHFCVKGAFKAQAGSELGYFLFSSTPLDRQPQHRGYATEHSKRWRCEGSGLWRYCRAATRHTVCHTGSIRMRLVSGLLCQSVDQQPPKGYPTERFRRFLVGEDEGLRTKWVRSPDCLHSLLPTRPGMWLPSALAANPDGLPGRQCRRMRVL